MTSYCRRKYGFGMLICIIVHVGRPRTLVIRHFFVRTPVLYMCLSSHGGLRESVAPPPLYGLNEKSPATGAPAAPELKKSALCGGAGASSWGWIVFVPLCFCSIVRPFSRASSCLQSGDLPGPWNLEPENPGGGSLGRHARMYLMLVRPIAEPASDHHVTMMHDQVCLHHPASRTVGSPSVWLIVQSKTK